MASGTDRMKKDPAATRGALVGGHLALSAVISICTAVGMHDRGGAARWFLGPFWLMLAIGVLLLARKDKLGRNALLSAVGLLVASVVSFVLGWDGTDMLLFAASVIPIGHGLWRRRGKRPD